MIKFQKTFLQLKLCKRKNSTYRIHAFLFLLVLLSFQSCFPEDKEDYKRVYISGRILDSKTKKPLENIVVSDGFKTELTNSNGRYSLESTTEATHVFVSIPESYEVTLIDGIPQFYKEIYGVKDSMTIDFKLTPLENGIEDEFTLVAIADPQVYNLDNVKRFKNETVKDIELEINKSNPVYGVTLGDLVDGGKLDLLREMRMTLTSITIPFFNVIGNHDFTSEAISTIGGAANFISYFGPLNYSFNRGNVHFIVMNNVFNDDVKNYKWGFSQSQIDWLVSDLQYVPKSKMIIVCVHVPVLRSTTMRRKHEFLEALSSFKEVHILSGHTHSNYNAINLEHEIYEHTTGAASGLWWNGTINKCGAPNGYAVYDIKGNTMKNWYYKSVNYDRNFQIKLYSPQKFGDMDGYVVANIWNADDNWKIELYEDDVKVGVMERFIGYDPGVYEFVKTYNQAEGSNWFQKTDHLYRLKAKNSLAKFSVKATDRFGNVFFQDEVIEDISTLKQYKKNVK